MKEFVSELYGAVDAGGDIVFGRDLEEASMKSGKEQTNVAIYRIVETGMVKRSLTYQKTEDQS